MPQRGGLVGLHEHPSPTVWKSQIQKSSKNTLSGVIWRDVMRERTQKADAEILRAHHATFAGLSVDGLGRALFSSTLARVFSRGPLLQLKG